MASGWDITIRGLKAGYGDHVVLDTVTGVLPAGSVSVILGGSGCGKSTLLRQIIGLSKPMAGELIVGDRDILRLPRREFSRLRRNMGVLFQDGALLGALTLAENVVLPLSEHLSLTRAALRREALRVLEMVGLEGFADFYPNELSGGMRKRAGLARAIVAEPKILLCDEPTSGLDPITAARMDDLLLAMNRHFPDMTTVVVSHDMASVWRIADNVMVIREGRSIFCGTPEELKRSEDPYLVRFLSRESDEDGADVHAEMAPEVRASLDRWLAG
ncbi:MAG: ATP-binding cassette domain-containing protein [Desulfovibrionaceae bacterium]|nr:ATP-binding cassette domain-containing protein [Desulfovibrionaceae bacterium]